MIIPTWRGKINDTVDACDAQQLTKLNGTSLFYLIKLPFFKKNAFGSVKISRDPHRSSPEGCINTYI